MSDNLKTVLLTHMIINDQDILWDIYRGNYTNYAWNDVTCVYFDIWFAVPFKRYTSVIMTLSNPNNFFP